MTGAATVAHLRTIWRDLAEQAAIDGDWSAADNAGAAYDLAKAEAEVARLRAVWQATYDQFDRDDAYAAYMTAQFALKESHE